MTQITVLLADDHTIVREGLRAMLEAEGDFEVVAEAANGREAVDLTQTLRPAVVVLDIAMPQLNGLEAARQILQRVVPPPRVLILSAHGDDAYVEQVVALGVAGYLVKQTSAHILAKAIREVYNGKTFYSPSVARRLVDARQNSPHRTGRAKKGAIPLTAREREVLQLVAEGGANKQVAAALGISIKTVEKHRQSVMKKLNIHDTAGLTRYAISAGVIESCVQCTIT
ncbi:MAG: DNA-binding response regulator [Lentisphaerae bacterium RIFOXYB12_FULL_65_16]|nr:MAG: DNA-binding response regulator [Lentisphaerae bacterium RIFOXYA12_64_32]OGV92683.1 MAG: DNA-binding response regulator [Lentisphaerae bacterium RIFOXYB12_FULL_65_16]